MTAWEPSMDHGTWHPCGYRISPVRYEQRVNGTPTGLFFVVPRWRYWWISALASVVRWPLAGRLARRMLAGIRVEYRWTWLHRGTRGEA